MVPEYRGDSTLGDLLGEGKIGCGDRNVQEGTGGLKKLLPNQTHKNEYYNFQCSTWNEQGATGDPGVLQSQSQPDGVLWRVSEGSGMIWAAAGEPRVSCFCFSSYWTNLINFSPLLLD